MNIGEISLKNGVVYQDAEPLHASELKALLDGQIETNLLCPAVFDLRQSRRPARLTYCLSHGAEPAVSVKHRALLLSKLQILSAKNLGYFICLDRVFYLHDLERTQLATATNKPTIAQLLKLTRVLKIAGQLGNAPEIILHNLALKQLTKPKRSNLFKKELYPYQETGVDWLTFCTSHTIGTILADDMGLGKTAQVIALTCNILEQEPESKILIVVPTPLLENWRREFLFFAPSVEPFIHYGRGRSGLSSDLVDHSVVITPYTTMTQDISMLSEIPFKLALYDEASMVKNPSSARTKTACAIDAEVKIAMTGTPVENSLKDAWSLAELVFPGYLGDAKTFARRYCDTDLGVILDTNLEELENSLRQITIRRIKKDVLKQLPDKIDFHIPVLMSEQEQASHDRIISELQAAAADGERNILSKITRLQQFAAHPALLNDTIDTTVDGLMSTSGKFELLISYLDKIQSNREKVLIFATFHKAIDLIANATKSRYGLSAGVIDGRTPNAERQPLIDCFSASDGFDVLVLHPKTAGMGFNITAASNVIHYSRQWNPALEQQATARAWRNGQQNSVMAYYFFYANTIEETVDERLKLKQQLSDKVVSVTEEKESDKKLILRYLEQGKIQ